MREREEKKKERFRPRERPWRFTYSRSVLLRPSPSVDPALFLTSPFPLLASKRQRGSFEGRKVQFARLNPERTRAVALQRPTEFQGFFFVWLEEKREQRVIFFRSHFFSRKQTLFFFRPSRLFLPSFCSLRPAKVTGAPVESAPSRRQRDEKGREKERKRQRERE